MREVSQHELLTMSIGSFWELDQYFASDRAIARSYAENAANGTRAKNRVFRGAFVIAIGYERRDTWGTNVHNIACDVDCRTQDFRRPARLP